MTTARKTGPVETAGDDLLVERLGAVMRITFNRPQARNALTFAMYRRLAEVVRGLADEPAIRALLITGAGGKAFAAGTDIGEFRDFSSPDDAIAYERQVAGILDVVECSRVPTIAAIAGACTGGGFGIAACCDLRIATADARFGVPIARTLGNCLSLTSHARIASLIGPARLKDMILTARLVDSREMHLAGLLTEVVTDADALAARALALAEAVASHAPITMQVTRESLRALAVPVDPALEEELFLKAYQSKDFAEGVDAFLSRRPARWTGN